MIKKIVTISLIIFVVAVGIILGVSFLTKQNTKTTNENQNTVVPTDNTDSKTITLSQVSQHATSDNCWLIVSDKVYNVTDYISTHPGGPDKIISFCGKDATTAFTTRGGDGHSPTAQEKLSSYYVEELAK